MGSELGVEIVLSPWSISTLNIAHLSELESEFKRQSSEIELELPRPKHLQTI